MLIRRLGSGDGDVLRILAVDNARFDEPGEGGALQPLTPRAAEHLLANEQAHVLVAFLGEEPVGFLFAFELLRRAADVGPSELYVDEVGVRSDHRREGIGRALLDALSQLARGRGITSGFVFTNASNGPARALYESFGGTRPNADDVMFDFRLG
ncbi:MAG: family acetyltransferase [Actinomycetia bacterium]|nr:family acetyltransferase [Actinomycetes bacterium]